MSDLPPPPGSPEPQQPGWGPPPPQPSYPPPGQPDWGPPPPQPGYPPPPSYGAPNYGYGYTAGPTAAVRALGGLAVALYALLAVAGIAALVFALALQHRANVLGRPFSAADASSADDRVAGGAGFFVLASLATGVVWIIWQYRHAKNAELLGKRGGLGAGWAIGGWFIPVGSLVLPELQLSQAAKASDPTGVAGQGRAPSVLYAWWAAWVLQSVVSFSSRRFVFGTGGGVIHADTDLETFRANDRTAAFAYLITVAAAVLGILTVKALGDRQRRALVQRGLLAP